MSFREPAIRGLVMMLMAASGAPAQPPGPRPGTESFEVGAVTRTAPDWKGGRFMMMQSANRFVARNHTLKTLIAAAWNLNPKEISGGPSWADTEHFDILAKTPGDVRPTLEDQMAMLRNLLMERFGVGFHREEREMSIYALAVGKGGAKLKESTASINATPAGPPPLVFVVYPGLVRLPARNASIAELTWVLQRAVLDRPVVDQTGIRGRYDFDLEFAPDESQFGGELPRPAEDSGKPGLFSAMQEQLGLKLEATRGKVQAMVIDRAERPSDN